MGETGCGKTRLIRFMCTLNGGRLRDEEHFNKTKQSDKGHSHDADVHDEDVYDEDVYNEDVYNEDVYNEDVYDEDVYDEDVYDVYDDDGYDGYDEDYEIERYGEIHSDDSEVSEKEQIDDHPYKKLDQEPDEEHGNSFASNNSLTKIYKQEKVRNMYLVKVSIVISVIEIPLQ